MKNYYYLVLFIIISGIFIFGAAFYSFKQLEESTTKKNSNFFTKEAEKLNYFNSNYINLSFLQPSGSNYFERKALDETNKKYTGKMISFKDGNDIAPPFYALTKNFSATSSVIHDILEGNLNSAESFDIKIFNNQFTKTIEKGENIYHVIGYSNIECSPSISSLLIVKPEVKSNIKYIYFSLGSINKFEENKFANPCTLKEDVIKNLIQDILNGNYKKMDSNLRTAIKISESFNY